jgi:hypothetical protein
MTEAALACPFCESPEVEVISAWGGQLITSQLRCRGCHTYFEALRDTPPWAEESPSTSN